MMNLTIVKTKQGDTWDILAKKLYGDERYMDELIKANLHLRKTAIFSAGVVLQVPSIDTASQVDETKLPSWLRGRG